jgi:hypothetical protein
MPSPEVRQIDPGAREASVVRGHVALATGFVAWEMGLDPLRTCAFDFSRFSDRNHFHALVSDARAMGYYLTATAQNITVSDLARMAGVEKQQVSRWLMRVSMRYM